MRRSFLINSITLGKIESNDRTFERVLIGWSEREVFGVKDAVARDPLRRMVLRWIRSIVVTRRNGKIALNEGLVSSTRIKKQIAQS